jgi:hypothetical protein
MSSCTKAAPSPSPAALLPESGTTTAGKQLTLDFSSLFNANPLAGLNGLANALHGFNATGAAGALGSVTNITNLVNSLKTVGTLVNAVTGATAGSASTTGSTTTGASLTVPAAALDPTQVCCSKPVSSFPVKY